MCHVQTRVELSLLTETEKANKEQFKKVEEVIRTRTNPNDPPPRYNETFVF